MGFHWVNYPDYHYILYLCILLLLFFLPLLLLLSFLVCVCPHVHNTGAFKHRDAMVHMWWAEYSFWYSGLSFSVVEAGSLLWLQSYCVLQGVWFHSFWAILLCSFLSHWWGGDCTRSPPYLALTMSSEGQTEAWEQSILSTEPSF